MVRWEVGTGFLCCQVGVVTNGNEQDDNNPDVEEMSKGFNIQYTQVAC